ncbi:MAG: hypothetical protein ACK5HR_04545 [Mycoplasmatales bacterium]
MKSEDKVKFIKKIYDEVEFKNEVYFKKISPVILKSTIDQLEKKDNNNIYSKILNENKVLDTINNMYLNVRDKKKRSQKNIYILPNLLKPYQKENTPTIFIDDKDYIDLMLQSIGEKRESNFEYTISSGKGISVIKLNKLNKGKNYFFNVVGAAFKFETNDRKVLNKIVKLGCGHIRGYGFGYAYTLDETPDENIKFNNNKMLNGK